jgi:surfactin synthase thioesterase subunit
LLFCFPYGGAGASFYHRWPATVAGMRVCLLQPPGRENRIREPIHPTHEAFAEDFVGFLDRGGYLNRPYSFIGHCGGVPLALQTILRLEDLGLPLPRRLFASSWGAPHRGLYGPLMVVDIDIYDFEREVHEQAARVGVPIPADLAAIGARVLRADLMALLPWLYDAERFLPIPVTVLAWSRDEVVPPEQAVPGWEECAKVSSEVLDGDHLEFMQCPPALREVIARDLLTAD